MQSNQGSTLILKWERLNVITFSNPVEAIDNFERILNYTYNLPSSDSSGDDVINSGAGDDTTYDDNLNGTVAGGNDIINSDDGDDINNGGGEDYRIISGSGNVINNGDAEDDKIKASKGDDTLTGGTGGQVHWG